MTSFIVKYYRQIIIFCILTGLIFCCFIPFIRTDPEIRNYIPAGMKSRVETDKIEKEFGVQDMIIILFRDSCILSSDDLERIKIIDKDISDLSFISDRISPFTVRKITSSEGMMMVNPMIEKIPESAASVSVLRKEILTNQFARDIVFSSDMTTASISATLNIVRDEGKSLSRIDSILASHPGKAEVMKGGLPVIRQHILKDVRKDAVILAPLALLIMLLILKLTLGEWRSVLLPFSVVVISTGITMGLIPVLGWKLSIITLLVPIILVAVANNYGIYLTARYQEIVSEEKGSRLKESIIKELLGSLNMPILFSGLTTIAGILGLLTHSIIPARQVGVLAATGVTFALAMSLLLVPAFLYSRKKEFKPAKKITGRQSLLMKVLDKLPEIIIRHPRRIIAVSIGFTSLLSAGIFLLKIETNQENFFPEKSPVRQTSNLINSKFGGSQTISVMISGDIIDPRVMGGIDRMTQEVGKMKGVGNVFSISKAIREMSKAVYSAGEDGYDRIPSTREGIAQLFELYNMSGNPADLKQMVNLEYTKAHVLIRLSDPQKKVILSVKKALAGLTVLIPGDVTIGGYAVIMNDFAESVIRGQASSLLFALVTVFILLTIVFRSFKGGIIGSIPLFASIIILFGFMGFAGIALDSATALLSSIMIGVGVDFTIQYIWCFNIHRSGGLSWEESTRQALRTIGRSIIINAFSVMAGFSALLISGFTSIRFFGYLVIISMGSCFAGAIILIPAIIVTFRPRFAEMNMNKTILNNDEKKDTSIDAAGISGSAAGTAAGR